ncbi:SDR family NAD(P)-dependent oxidoreductase [Alishewanella sp. d11]|uniref:SDR family NAD(P)-dependent oxidoreductase n=1 Tax=Alishewanella sp. d11 TaxID=3414030 RepID=UPI003BF81A67
MPKHWLIIGANGGIGAALVQTLLQQGERVTAISRQPLTAVLAATASAQLNSYTLADIEADSAETILSAIFQDKVDAVVLCQGWLHGAGFLPEKSIKQLCRGAMQQSLEVNLLQPALYLQRLLPFLQKQQKVNIAVLSAKVGSITDNQLGGWYSYRMAKAAINMLVKCASIELARYNKEASLVTLHPGTTDTDMSAPFQKNLPQGQLRSAEASAAHIIQVVSALTPEQSGALVNWDGSLLPF